MFHGSITNPQAGQAGAKGGKRKQKAGELSDDDVVEVGEPAAQPAQPGAERITSSNAYMLIYCRRGWQPPDGAVAAAVPPECGPAFAPRRFASHISGLWSSPAGCLQVGGDACGQT